MASTYNLITRTTVSSANGVISLTSIPQTYTDLVIQVTGVINASTSDGGIYVRVNGDSTTTYNWTMLYGNGSSAGSSAATSATSMLIGAIAGLTSGTATPGTSTINVLGYSFTNVPKRFLGTGALDQNGSGEVDAFTGWWNSNSAITQIDLRTYNGTSATFAVGTTVSLYGIARS